MITNLGHIAFDCYYFERTLDFYTQVLGFEHMFDLLDDEGKLWIVYLRVSDTGFLELFPKDSAAPSEKDRVFSHFCLEVDDIEATVREITERGATLEVPIRGGKDGNLQAWTRDPEGNRIELMQLAPDSLQKQAIERLRNG